MKIIVFLFIILDRVRSTRSTSILGILRNKQKDSFKNDVPFKSLLSVASLNPTNYVAFYSEMSPFPPSLL